jgi:hypothetical protein
MVVSDYSIAEHSHEQLTALSNGVFTVAMMPPALGL